MISYIKGKFIDIVEDQLILETNQIGYSIRIPLSDISKLSAPGENIHVFTYLHVREDALNLYGFLNKDDLHLFKMLISVSGIGPKGAIGILSGLSSDELRYGILTEDVKLISKAPGVGLKTAKRLIVELKDKIHFPSEEELSSATSPMGKLPMTDGKIEAVEALTALGYSGVEALKSVNQVAITETMNTEDILKEALKKMSIL